MTPEQQRAAGERLRAATPGPWARAKDVVDFPKDKPEEWGHCFAADIVAFNRNPASDNPYDRHPAVISSWGHDADGVSIEDADAEFIAHAPEDLRRALDALERVEALAGRLEEAAAGLAVQPTIKPDDPVMHLYLSASQAVRAALSGRPEQ